MNHIHTTNIMPDDSVYTLEPRQPKTPLCNNKRQCTNQMGRLCPNQRDSTLHLIPAMMSCRRISRPSAGVQLLLAISSFVKKRSISFRASEEAFDVNTSVPLTCLWVKPSTFICSPRGSPRMQELATWKTMQMRTKSALRKLLQIQYRSKCYCVAHIEHPLQLGGTGEGERLSLDESLSKLSWRSCMHNITSIHRTILLFGGFVCPVP